MLQKAADELRRRECHRPLALTVHLAVAKHHLSIVGPKEALLRDRHLEHKAGEILEARLRVADRLAIDVPVNRPDGGVDLSEPAGGVHRIAELRPEDRRQGPHGQKATAVGRVPAAIGTIKPAARDHVVEMRMVLELPAPGVQHPQAAWRVRPQVLVIGGQGLDGPGGCRE